MGRKISVSFVLLFLVLSLGSIFADGGGGILIGYQAGKYPFFEKNYLASRNMGLMYYGGFGYGLQGRRVIHGGFGYAISDPTGESNIWGGFGGPITGFRIIRKPVTISITSWTGFGGVYTGRNTVNPDRGFFCISEDLQLEIGLPILRWFMPVIFVGYQVSANLVPAPPIIGFLSYTPVMGMRITWGKFR